MSDIQLIEKYGGAVPRYTSYPTALQFHNGVDASVTADWLREARGATSVYIHMAYCKSLCLYCGCNMKVTNKLETVSAYVDSLLQEMDMVAGLLPEKPDVAAIHLGGGTPSYAAAADIERIFAKVVSGADVRRAAEVSMEIDPRQLPESLPPVLGELGFNRASLGIQDTNAAVQEAIRRVQPHELNKRAVKLLRAHGVRDINLDLLYGLPRQTVATIRQTVRDVMELEPARISLFGYAHVPWMKKHQAVLEQYGIPGQVERMELFDAAAEALLAAGYVAIGFDHFCLPTDPMAKAAKQGSLHRNFMGFTTDEAPVLLGYGASAISQYPHGYAQNVSAPHDYMAALAEGRLPVARGVRVSEDDVARRTVIESLLCGMAAEGQGLERMVMHPQKLRGMVVDGLAEWRGDTLRVTEKGRPYVRAVASCFDAYYRGGGGHSRI